MILRNEPFRGELIPGCDLSERRAEMMVEWGQATWGRSYTPPPALYLLEDVDLRGLRWPAGTRLTPGFEVSEAEALMLMRGLPDRPLCRSPSGRVSADVCTRSRTRTRRRIRRRSTSRVT